MTPSLRVGVDIDGVLSNFTDAFADTLAHATGRRLVTTYPYQPPVWDWPQAVGYTQDEVDDAWKKIHRSTDFWQELRAHTGAVTFLDRLWRWAAFENWTLLTSHEICFITSRDGLRVKDQTERWLERHGFGGKHPTVLIARGDKGPLVQTLGLTHVVDDRPENIQSYMAHGLPAENAVLYRASYNDAFAASHPQSVSSLEELAVRWRIR